MNTRLVGILVCMLLIVTTIPVMGLTELEHNNIKDVIINQNPPVKENIGQKINPTQMSGIDLSDWSGVYLDLEDTEQGLGDWQLSPDKTMVTETLNADPCFFINDKISTKFEATFKCRVNTTTDDDYIGIVFGYNSPSQYYIMDWRSGDEHYYSGFMTKLIDAPSENDLLENDFWTDTGSDYTTILDSKTGPDFGWNEFENYTIYILFDRGIFQITVENDLGEDLYYLSINEGHFKSGKIGFYVNSQENVEFSAIEFINSANSHSSPVINVLTKQYTTLKPLQTPLRSLLGELKQLKIHFN